MNIILIIILLIGHWISDYIFQSTDKVLKKGLNKDKLLTHTVEYTTSMSAFVLIALLFNVLNQELWYFIISFWIITFAFHYLIDYVTSKISIDSWNNNSIFGYFSVIITDQMLHLIVLFLTIYYLFY